MDKPTINIKFLAWFAVIFLLLSLYFNISQHIKNKELQEYKDTTLEELKAEKDSIINAKELHIESLVKDNELKDVIILDAKERYDSLEISKSKVRVIYRVKYKEIEVFNANEVENYWNDEFN